MLQWFVSFTEFIEFNLKFMLYLESERNLSWIWYGIFMNIPSLSMLQQWININIFISSHGIITARKRSLRRLCFYTCLSFCPQWGACVVAPRGVCMVAPRVVAPGGHAWLLRGGMHGCCGSVRGCSRGGGRAWDTIRYGQWAGGTHPTGMHSCYRCLTDKNCYAYQYKEPGPGNCLLIHEDDDCIITGGQIFERDDSSVVYIKGIMCVLYCLKISKMYPSFTSFGSNGIPHFCAISSSLVCIAWFLVASRWVVLYFRMGSTIRMARTGGCLLPALWWLIWFGSDGG